MRENNMPVTGKREWRGGDKHRILCVKQMKLVRKYGTPRSETLLRKKITLTFFLYVNMHIQHKILISECGEVWAHHFNDVSLKVRCESQRTVVRYTVSMSDIVNVAMLESKYSEMSLQKLSMSCQNILITTQLWYYEKHKEIVNT
jgi:hypothetical protein